VGLTAACAGGALAQTGEAGRADCDGHAVGVYAVPGTHSQPPYPPLSQRLGEQGSSVLRLTIGRDGEVEDTAITRSSGSNRLDAAAQDWVRRTWRWQQSGHACRSLTTIVTVNWSLVDAHADSSEAGR
jgi:TonB family protein